MNKPDWPRPTDLRCVGGPADGKWFEVPPEGYERSEPRGGAFWLWIGQKDAPGLTGLPCESGPEPKP